MSEGSDRLADVKGRIDAAARAAGRTPADTTLVHSRPDASVDRAAYSAWLKQLRAICTERGSPSEPNPDGTEAAGCPVTFQTPLKGTIPAIAFSVQTAPLPSNCPTRGGGVAVAGAISTSWSSSTVFILRLRCVREFTLEPAVEVPPAVAVT